VTDPDENMAGYRQLELTVHAWEVLFYLQTRSGGADASGRPGTVAA
jgi:hypothetical protein